MTSGSLDPESRHVGERLASHRRIKGWSGKELAARVGMNQPKISRIETGAVIPDPADVRLIAEALDLSTKEIADLVGKADEAHATRDRHTGQTDLAGKQSEVADYELKGKAVRIFQANAIAGLLQTSTYAQEVITGHHRRLASLNRQPSEAARFQAIANRVQRRESMLASRTQVFVVLSEAALASRLFGDDGMLEQIEFLQELVADDHVSLRVIPFATVLPFPLVNGFELVDERWLVVDMFHGSTTSRDKEEVRLYRRLFEELWEVATPEVEPILAEYARRYKSSSSS